jgi:hypothetical protein
MGSRAENKFYHYADGIPPFDFNGTWNLFVQDFEPPDSGSITSCYLTICQSGICQNFNSNETNITIPDVGIASAYPITFDVTGITKIDSIWDDAILAEGRKAQLKLAYEIMFHSSPPCTEEEYYQDIVSEQISEAYYTWLQDKYYAEDMSEPVVKEFEINKI